MSEHVLANVTCVAVGGRGLLIEGPPGSGKSSLALALIDRGAVLVGDDGVRLEVRGERLWAHPPPNIAGKIEVRGIGIASLPTASAPLCLVLTMEESLDRLPVPVAAEFAGSQLPRLPLPPPRDALRAEWALRLHGLALPAEIV